MIIEIMVTIALIGLVAWALTYFIPMPVKLRTAIWVVAGVGILLYVLGALGLWGGFGNLGIRRR